LNALEALGPAKMGSGARTAEVDDATRANWQQRFVCLEGIAILLRLLAPITPHVAHALWNELGCSGNLLDAGWPKADPEALKKASVTLAVQVNGKLRGTIDVAVDAPREAIEQTAMANADVAKYVGTTPPKKIIIVPGKIVNIVV